MLIVTCHNGEAIKIGEDVYVIVNKIKGKQVSLKFIAPDEVDIWRDEVPYEDEDMENSQGTKNLFCL